ncbi:hypothetical protein [Streptomyces sp. SID13031]|uniref:hypothetical protein n=1 Tax=Streptomyces sp. SID13031 TaxID=2706046 RepID=UPI0013C77D08|nr:hypothetical protein [Streptomyces sp. SID13031]NEA30207.1 hypothetical protein [Streptomyces sp. SID13031]
MSNVPTAGPKAVPVPQWDLDRQRYDMKLPNEDVDFAVYVAALPHLAVDSAEVTLTATHPDQTIAQRTWTGPCVAEELALMLAKATRVVLQVTYADGSRLWLESGRTERWRWTTSGEAQDAVSLFTRSLRKSLWRRRFRIGWPFVLGMSALVGLLSWGKSVPAADPKEPDGYDYTGPLWYTLLCVVLMLIAVVGALTTDHSGFGRTRQRYLGRLASPGTRSWRRFFTVRPLDVTNGVVAALAVGVMTGVLIALIFGSG